MTPPKQCVKLNVDGAFSEFSGVAASGGLIRNTQGKFVARFMAKIEEGDSLTAKIWAWIHGLRMAWDMGEGRVVPESDAIEVIDLLLAEEVPADHQDYSIVTMAQQLMNQEWVIKVQHVRRD